MAPAAAFKLRSKYTRKPDDPETGNFVSGGARKPALPASQGAQNCDPTKKLSQRNAPAQACEGPAQGSTATAQGCLLIAQVKTASAQV
jgi:hypothetical protein